MQSLQIFVVSIVLVANSCVVDSRRRYPKSHILPWPNPNIVPRPGVFNGDVNCKKTPDGSDYTGDTSVTTSGRTCQAWASQSPHSHSIGTHLPENYCRNPDGEPGPWCYTTDPNVRWELCDIPDCGFGDVHCKMTPDGSDYAGYISKTILGKTCQDWASQSPHPHSIGTNLPENYCRNPDGAPRPWCYTTDPNVRWDFCDIPDYF